MFPPDEFGVGVTVSSLAPDPWEEVPLPAGVVSSRPSRIGDLLPVAWMTAEQKATQLQRVQQAKSVLAAYEVELVVGLADDRPSRDDRRGQVGAASGEWADDLLDEDVSEFFADELALVLNCSRTAATTQWEVSATLFKRLPRTWAALADGVLDWPRARAIAAELGWPARETPDAVLAGVEAVVLPHATGLSITRLRALARAELVKADPAASDRRRKQAERAADVTVRGAGDGMGELRAFMPYPEAAEMRAVADAHARAAKVAATTGRSVCCAPSRSTPGSPASGRSRARCPRTWRSSPPWTPSNQPPPAPPASAGSRCGWRGSR